jgi:hypothetical protein
MPRHPPNALIALDLSLKPVMYRDQKPEPLNLHMPGTLAIDTEIMMHPPIRPKADKPDAHHP